MKDLSGKVFIFLVVVLFMYVFFRLQNIIYLNFLHNFIPQGLWIVVFILTFFIIIWAVYKLHHWMEKLRFQRSIELSVSIIILFFFMFQIFTVYFFTENYLIGQGERIIEKRYEVYSGDLKEEELKKLADENFTDLMAFATLMHLEQLPNRTLLDLTIDDFQRRYNHYELTVTVEEEIEGGSTGEVENNQYQFTFSWVRTGFRLSGMRLLSS